jgi:hypothetical protein
MRPSDGWIQSSRVAGTHSDCGKTLMWGALHVHATGGNNVLDIVNTCARRNDVFEPVVRDEQIVGSPHSAAYVCAQ